MLARYRIGSDSLMIPFFPPHYIISDPGLYWISDWCNLYYFTLEHRFTVGFLTMALEFVDLKRKPIKPDNLCSAEGVSCLVCNTYSQFVCAT